MKKTLLAILLALAVILVLLGGVTWWSKGLYPGALLFGFAPSAQDADEAGAVATFVENHYAFTEKSKSMPEKAPVFCTPGARGILGPSPHTIIVYTVVDEQQQDQIVDLIRQYRRQTGLRPILIRFYRAESWTTRTTSDGGELGFRGKEELLRSEKVR